MKIVFVGGGTGGHFYPHIAVAQQIHAIVEERRLLEPELIYIGPAPFDSVALTEQNIADVRAPAGRVRRYASILNVLDVFRTFAGVISASVRLFSIFPDVVFSTGGYAAFPTLIAARFFGIPVIMYDADAKPGRVSLWSAKFARWIAVAHPDAIEQFPLKVREKIVRVGHPIRIEVETPTREGGAEFLKLQEGRPTVFVTCGSHGAQAINEVIIEALPQLIAKYNVIHQTGKANLDEVVGMVRINSSVGDLEDRYRAFGLLNAYALRLAAGMADVVVSRAGSGTIFEIAMWGKPAIVIPIPQTISHDQTRNAFSYARSGAAVVIEQNNLTKSVLLAEIDRIVSNPDIAASMAKAAKEFAQPGAAHKIAKALLDVGIEHM